MDNGEHEYTRYGFRQLIESKSIDILQPDVMWVGGMTELIKFLLWLQLMTYL